MTSEEVSPCEKRCWNRCSTSFFGRYLPLSISFWAMIPVGVYRETLPRIPSRSRRDSLPQISWPTAELHNMHANFDLFGDSLNKRNHHLTYLFFVDRYGRRDLQLPAGWLSVHPRAKSSFTSHFARYANLHNRILLSCCVAHGRSRRMASMHPLAEDLCPKPTGN